MQKNIHKTCKTLNVCSHKTLKNVKTMHKTQNIMHHTCRKCKKTVHKTRKTQNILQLTCKTCNIMHHKRRKRLKPYTKHIKHKTCIKKDTMPNKEVYM